MSTSPIAVRLAGDPAVCDRLTAALAGRFILVTPEQPTERTSLLLFAGPAHQLPPTRGGPALLLVPRWDPAALSLLRSGVAEVLLDSAPADEVVARADALWRRHQQALADSWRREVEHLLELIRDLATSGGLPTLLLSIVQKLADAVGVERCSLVLFDDGDEHPLQATVVAASDRPDLEPVRIQLADYPEIREALRTGAPVVVSDTEHHPLLEGVRRQIAKVGIGALAVFPLVVEGRVLGVLIMRARRSFERPESIALARSAAVATTIAVRHGRLVEQAAGHATKELERYEEFIQHISDGVAVLDADAQILLLNPAGAAILAVHEDARGRRLHDIATPTDMLAAKLLFRELGRGGRVLNADLEVVLGDGRRAVLAVSAGQLRRYEGRAILSFRDVTEQRVIEAELRRTRDFQERLIDASTDAIVAGDLKGRIIVFNRAAEKLFGVSATEARRTLNVRDLYPQGGATEVMRMLRASGSGQIESVRAYGRTAKEELIPLELSAALVSVGGREVATVGLLRDLRERVRVESELARARARLIEAEKQQAITALAGATAHELNQPLTAVLGLVELLRRKADDATRKQLDTIAAQADRMAEIVKKIAKLTRIETMAYPGEKVIADIEKSSENKLPVVKASPILRR